MITEPAATPVTTPEELIVAKAVLLLAHVPPPVVSVSVAVFPTHTAVLPTIPGIVFGATESTCVV
jgi:hypothetical protein